MPPDAQFKKLNANAPPPPAGTFSAPVPAAAGKADVTPPAATPAPVAGPPNPYTEQLKKESADLAVTGSALPGGQAPIQGAAGTAPGGVPIDKGAYDRIQAATKADPTLLDRPDKLREIASDVPAGQTPEQTKDLAYIDQLTTAAGSELAAGTAAGTPKSFVDTYNDLVGKDTYGGTTMSDLDRQLLDLKNAELGAAQDVKGELTAAGGLVTSSAVAEAAARRNAVIDVQMSRLQNLKTLKQSYIDKQIELGQKDRDAVGAHFDRSIKLAETSLDLRKPFNDATAASQKAVLDMVAKYPDAGIDPAHDSALDAANKVKASTSFQIELLKQTRLAQGSLTPVQQLTAARALANEMVNEGLYSTIEDALPAALASVRQYASGGGLPPPPPSDTGAGGFTGAPGVMRTDRNNNPTAMTTDVAKTLGLVEGKDYTAGDPFQGGVTAKLIGDPVAVTIKALDAAAQDPKKQAFYTDAGGQRWTHTAISDADWLAKTPEQKRQLVGQMYQREGGSGELMPDVKAAVAALSGGKPLANPVDEQAAQDLAAGRVDPSKYGSVGRSPKTGRYTNAIVQRAEEINPDFNPAGYATAYKYANNSQTQQAIVQIDTVSPNIDTIIGLSDAFKRSDFPAINAGLRALGYNVGSKDISNLQELQNIIADELGKALAGNAALSDAKLTQAQQAVAINQSPDQFVSAMGILKNALVNRKKAIWKQAGAFASNIGLDLPAFTKEQGYDYDAMKAEGYSDNDIRKALGL